VDQGEDARYLRGYIRAWAAFVIIGAFVLGIALIVAGSVGGLPKAFQNISQAVGSSVVASLILYVLVSLLIDPKRQMAQARQAVMYGIEEANHQFSERFEVALPTALYEGSKIPKPIFRDAFVGLLKSSTRYDFKGDSAKFTTYRLARCCDHPEIRRLDQIRLCVLDPRAERAMHVYAEQYLRQDGAAYNAARTAQTANQIKTDIFVSLWILFGIRQRITVTVFFHSDLPFFRCELFDSGMLLTYYLDRRVYPDYPETLQFSPKTRPFRAYSSAMSVARQFAPKKVVFGEMGPDGDLINTDQKFSALMTSLGCEFTTEELDRHREERFQTLDKWLGEASLNTSELF
jgi:hypothetical protein